MIKYCLTGTESLFGVEAMLRQPEGTATWADTCMLYQYFAL